MVSKLTPSVFSWSATSKAQFATPAHRAGARSRRPGSGRACRRPPRPRAGRPPTTSECRCRTRRVQPDIGPHHAGKQDVADLVVHRVVPRDPLLLDKTRLEPQVGGDRGHLSRVVGLDASDRDESVCAARERVGDDVLQLSDLVSAIGQTAADVLALRPDSVPPRCAVRRARRWTGLGPNIAGGGGTRATSFDLLHAGRWVGICRVLGPRPVTASPEVTAVFDFRRHRFPRTALTHNPLPRQEPPCLLTQQGRTLMSQSVRGSQRLFAATRLHRNAQVTTRLLGLADAEVARANARCQCAGSGRPMDQPESF